ELSHAAVQVDDVKLARFILTEGRNVEAAHRQQPLRVTVPGEDFAAAVIGIDVRASREHAGRAAINVTAGDRTTAVVVRVIEYGNREVRRVTTRRLALRAAQPFEGAPPIVAPSHDRRVDLFPLDLAHIAKPHRTIATAVEAEAPWIAHTVSEDF